MKTCLLVLSLMISAARSHFNYNPFHAASRSEPGAFYNNQQIRKPTYHHYPMTFFSPSAYSYQTTSKPYYTTTSSLATSHVGPSVTPYRPSPYVRPGIVYEYRFLGPPQPIFEDRYSTSEAPSTSAAELAVQQIVNVDPVEEVMDSHLISASATDQSDDTSTDATVQVSTNVLDDEELLPQSTTPAEEDVTTPLVEQVTEMKVTTLPDDITTPPDSTESPVTAERHQSIIPFYLRPSSWRARSFGPDSRYYHPNHYYGPEEARD